MATDEAKKANAQRMMMLSMKVLISEVWDTLGDSSIALADGMGDAVLAMMEKEQGLEIGGEDPAAIGKEIDRILVDEYGLANEVTLESDGTTFADTKISGCHNTQFCDQLVASGVKMPFICPVMLVSASLLKQKGIKAHITYERWQAGKGCIFHLKVA
jgi:hypothetical protein